MGRAGIRGLGELTLSSDGAEPAIVTGLTSTMAAFGGRGLLRRHSGGFELAVISDALLTNTVSEATSGLLGAEGETSRVRLMLEGSGTMHLATGGVLRPTLEAGLRYDRGDAENGGRRRDRRRIGIRRRQALAAGRCAQASRP